MRTIHRARRRAFKVYAFAVVAAAVTWTLELVLARFPIGRATKVRAAREDDKEAIRSLINPDAIGLLPLCINALRIVAGKTDAEGARWLEDGARHEEAHEREEADGQKTGDCCPSDAPPHLVHRRVGRCFDERAPRLRR